jgi:pyridoxal 5'-phosphate synthase pdxT subunit
MIGVLCLQGDFLAHQFALKHLGIKNKLVRLPEHLFACNALIIPGGESSTLLKLMAPLNFLDAIHKFYNKGGFIFGTCAGMILLAKQVEPKQVSLGLLDIKVERNAYGRQVDSTTKMSSKISSKLGHNPIAMTLIRAPRIVEFGDEVEVLVWDEKNPMLVQQDRILAASFHPELSCEMGSYDPRVIKYFSMMSNNIA